MESPIEGHVEIDIDDIWMELEDRVDDKLVESLKGSDSLAASAAREVFEDMDLDGKFESAIKEAVDEALESINDPLRGGAKERLNLMNKEIASLSFCVRQLHQQIIEVKQALEFLNSPHGHDFGIVKTYLKDNPDGFWDKPRTDRFTICTKEDKQEGGD
jgi:hypothetical protein